MKKLVSVIALFGAAACSFGQGQITYNNSASTLIMEAPSDGSTNRPAPPNVAGANPLIFAVFVAPQGTAAPASSTSDQTVGLNDANWQNAVLYANNSTAAAGAGRLQNPGVGTIASYASGSTVNFIVRGWAASMGSTWAQAQAYITGNPNAIGSIYGTSALAVNSILGGGALPVPTLWGAASSQIPGMQLIQVIPEPATFAVAGLGAAAMLIFRRRKS